MVFDLHSFIERIENERVNWFETTRERKWDYEFCLGYEEDFIEEGLRFLCLMWGGKTWKKEKTKSQKGKLSFC